MIKSDPIMVQGEGHSISKSLFSQLQIMAKAKTQFFITGSNFILFHAILSS